ncbi:hypothetical protein [Roseateles asaccharophilus]|uniref:Solute-binding protein family 3/N-terminal domain-containing protein n=1 Tax=Roseateles asaccharophilus TaxID=582607 RepID=A0ABU2AFT8_9BURK|nr:hypothetical protein [Roseateles asaccharophilus]MDR7336082.1 hypothetical protein [Roseateles asaccharophilus]
MLRRHCLLTGLPSLLAAGPALAQELVVTLRAPDSDSDSRNAYIRDAVQLALDKTRVIEGPYRLELSPRMSKSRALVEASRGEVRNFLVVAGVDAGRAAGLAPVPFPIHLGLNRFRVCFVHAPRQAAVRAATSVAAVARLRHVQGSDWPDVAVMRANGFKVTEVSAYESLFELVGLGRADLFCRNVLEIGDEIRAQAGTPGLAVDDSLLLSYDLPQYLYTHPSNRRAMERVARGLRQAYGDGSLLALLQRYVQPSLALLNLPQRRLVTLTTPTPAVVEMNDKPFQVDLQRLLAR